LKALQEYDTWEVDLPPDGNLVGSRWVFALKKDVASNIVCYKARLVAQGFLQIPGVDYFDTYAPVAKMASIQTFLALAAQLDYEIHQVNIKKAYLNRKFLDTEVIYMKQPPRVKLLDDCQKVLQLLKPLYGLKQSAHHWYNRLFGVLRNRLDMKHCDIDQAVFYYKNGNTHIIIVAHVDDLMIIALSMDLVKRVKDELGKVFKVSDLGEIHWLLGMEVKHNREK